jgi:NAD(P)-dependent dehydrogenase (short-subunit alcohol dehydrogenase family)
MANPFSYQGKRAVVTGGGGSGMGAATVVALSGLGAEVHVIDLQPPPADVASFHAVDLRDPGATAEAIDAIDGRIDALFNCAGLGGLPSTDVDIMLVNFVSPRHVASLVAPRMTEGGAIVTISSTGGASYLLNIQKWLPLVRTADFAEAEVWVRSHPDEIATGYIPSKEAVIIWTMDAAMELARRDIRINCISPGPTDTNMLATSQSVGPEIIDQVVKVMGRVAKPEEQAWPMIFLNSPAASYITGENINTDGGSISSMTTGRLTIDVDPDLFKHS